jgi:hypothetical protein
MVAIEFRITTGSPALHQAQTMFLCRQPREVEMTNVQAVCRIRTMLGHCAPQLMSCDDSALYVVKLQSSHYHSRHLVSEYLASEIARFVGLPVPDCAIVDVPPALVELIQNLDHQDPSPFRVFPGRQLGFRFIGRTGGASPTDYLPRPWLINVVNRTTFAGMFILDKWCGNSARRKAVFHQDYPHSEYSVQFIDHEGCFGGAAWELNSSPESGFYGNCAVYHDIGNWESFEPYLSRLLSMTPEILWQIAAKIPSEWYGDRRIDLEELVAKLVARRSRVHQLVAVSIQSCPKLFPSWRSRSPVFLSDKRFSAGATLWIDAPTGP